VFKVFLYRASCPAKAVAARRKAQTRWWRGAQLPAPQMLALQGNWRYKKALNTL